MEKIIKYVSLFGETLTLAYQDSGEGRPYLILHGGAGAHSMSGLAEELGKNNRALMPTHPGFGGEAKPEWLSSVPDLALAYLAFIERLNLHDVIVIGNSFGGWITAEMALRNSPRVAGIILLNAVGIDAAAAGKQIVDPLQVPPPERAGLAFHNPARYAIVPASPDAAATMLANQQTMRGYSGAAFMYDPGLRARLRSMSARALVIWGENDGIVDVAYGRRFATSMQRAHFELVAKAGHFPHIEQLQRVVALIDAFSGTQE